MTYKFYGNFKTENSRGKLSGQQCAALGRKARATATWKAYAATRKPPVPKKIVDEITCAKSELKRIEQYQKERNVYGKVRETDYTVNLRKRINELENSTPSIPSPSIPMPNTSRKTQSKAAKTVAIASTPAPVTTQKDAAQKAAEVTAQFSHVSTHHYDHQTRTQCNMLRGNECNRCAGLEQYAIDHPEHTHAYMDYPCTMLNGKTCSKCRVAITVNA